MDTLGGADPPDSHGHAIFSRHHVVMQRCPSTFVVLIGSA